MMNNILLIDDRKDFIEAFTADCTARGYALYARRSLAGLKELMPTLQHKIACVVLDIKCLHTEDQEIEDPSFLPSAITYLDQNFAKFPRMILTGDDKEYDQIKKYYIDEDIFLKTPEDKDRLFIKIKYYIDNSDELRIKRLNPEPFEAFKPGIIQENKSSILLNLIRIEESGLFQKNDFNTIRDLLEDVLMWLNLKGLLPSQCIKTDGRPNLDWSLRYLAGLHVDLPNGSTIKAPTAVLTKHVSRCAEAVKQIASIFSHTYNEKVTLNAYRAALYSLSEVLVWCKDYSKANFRI
ncbi:MAG TPA: hypothetical protein VK169_14620 [Saprospiraceae bacterium]|nr:hypothetical protein [Saprospiraceae bacterium]